MTDISNLIQATDGALSILSVLVLLFIAFLRYVSANSKEKKLSSVKASFVSIVEQLSSSSETEKMSAAILLRRFFDTKTEMGLRGKPFKKEAVNLISGMLKVEPVGRLQKTLGEGLIYAVSVTNQDLQKVNLHDVHLGKSLGYKLFTLRWNLKFWNYPRFNLFNQRFPDFTGSDFFQSDLSRASFADCDLVGCVFYEANCKKTVFKNAKLMKANFNEADLEGAKFSGANLQGATFEKAVLKDANFEGALNIPKSIKDRLNPKGIYQNDLDSNKAKFSVFVSKSAALNNEMTLHFNHLNAFLSKAGITTIELNRSDYKSYGMLTDIATRIDRSDGVVIFGVADFHVVTGEFRKNTPEYESINSKCLSAPWTQIEAGMAIAKNKPILLVNTCGLVDGIYDSKIEDDLMVSFNMNDKSCSNQLQQSIELFKSKLEV